MLQSGQHRGEPNGSVQRGVVKKHRRFARFPDSGEFKPLRDDRPVFYTDNDDAPMDASGRKISGHRRSDLSIDQQYGYEEKLGEAGEKKLLQRPGTIDGVIGVSGERFV